LDRRKANDGEESVDAAHGWARRNQCSEEAQLIAQWQAARRRQARCPRWHAPMPTMIAMPPFWSTWRCEDVARRAGKVLCKDSDSKRFVT
jgi:hypothetical protein